MRKELVMMVIVAVMTVVIHTVVIVNGNPEDAALLTALVAVLASFVACVRAQGFTAFTAFGVVIAAFTAFTTFTSYATFSTFATLLAIGVLTVYVAADAARANYGVPWGYGIFASAVYAGMVGIGIYTVGQKWPTAGYSAMWWHLIPAFGTAASALILRVGERVGNRPFIAS